MFEVQLNLESLVLNIDINLHFMIRLLFEDLHDNQTT